MQLIKLVVCTSVFVAITCSAELIMNTSKLDESSLIETLIAILESCYTDRFSTLGLAGPSAGIIMTKMSSRDTPIPVAMMDETAEVDNHDRVDLGSRHKLHAFVITTSNQTSLYETLVRIWWSKWWNHMASFLFVDLTESENGCSTAAEVLTEAWRLDLLNSKFVCLDRTGNQLIYTFNPFTNKAPVPWQLENTYEGMNGHVWTLLVREYRVGESCCDGLDFDKTVDLGGYEIRGIGRGMEFWWSKDSDFTPYLSARRKNVTAQFLMNSLNATWKVLSRPWDGPMINYYGNETRGIAAEVTGRIHDIMLSPVVQQGFYYFDITDVVGESQIMFVTQYPGHKSQLEKIISVLDKPSRFGVLVVLIITLLFLIFWLGQPLVPSILDIVLIISNAGIQRIPQATAPRIYLTSLFIVVVTIQGIYSGEFASLLTQDVRLRTIDTVRDLARSNYKIYGAYTHEKLFYDEAFEGRYFEMTNDNCEDDVLGDSKAACVEENLVAMNIANDNKLHLSRESVGYVYGVYLVRPDWPLRERVNEILRRAKAGGLLEILYSIECDSVRRSIKSYEEQEEQPEVKVLTLAQLNFAFVLLGIGLGCATVTFIIEVATFGTAIANLRCRIRR